MNQRFEEVNRRFGAIDRKLEVMDDRLARIESKLDDHGKRIAVLEERTSPLHR
ncbi:MAG: hemolysin XhlA family protein [Acidobacteriota bacterium]|nr:hemolysin XhlA family protein [Acidobacteriota bacterium]